MGRCIVGVRTYLHLGSRNQDVGSIGRAVELTGGGMKDEESVWVFQRSQLAVQSAFRLSASAVRVESSVAQCRVSAASRMEAIHRPITGEKWTNAVWFLFTVSYNLTPNIPRGGGPLRTPEGEFLWSCRNYIN